jgi:hypothetical protein
LPVGLFEHVGLEDIENGTRSEGTQYPCQEDGPLLLGDERIEIPGLRRGRQTFYRKANGTAARLPAETMGSRGAVPQGRR